MMTIAPWRHCLTLLGLLAACLLATAGLAAYGVVLYRKFRK